MGETISQASKQMGKSKLLWAAATKLLEMFLGSFTSLAETCSLLVSEIILPLVYSVKEKPHRHEGWLWRLGWTQSNHIVTKQEESTLKKPQIMLSDSVIYNPASGD